MSSKWKIERLFRDNDYGLWKVKTLMYAYLKQVEKTEMMDKARSSIILCFEDKALRKVIREKISSLIWKKIESIYMNRYLAYKLCLK